MSTSSHATSKLPASNLRKVLDEASKQYSKLTGEDLATHPCAAKLDDCGSADSVLEVFQDQAQEFNEFRQGNKRLMELLSPTVQILIVVSGSLGEVLGGHFPPAKGVFICISALLTAAAGLITSYDILVNLFERIQFFLQRLKIYTGIPLTTGLTEILGKIMAEIIIILGFAKKELAQGTLRKIMKRLAGKTPIENALQRLDYLTTEEVRTVTARHLEFTFGLDKRVDSIEEEAKNIARLQSRENLRSWIDAPNFSLNHDIARANQFKETGAWFTQGETFETWKTTGSLLWIRGIPGSGKTVLCSRIIEDIKSNGGLVLFFYFDSNGPTKRHLRGLLSSIIVQLCNKSDHCWHLLSKLYTKHNDGSEVPSEVALADCLKRTIKHLKQDSIYLVIDAIDECPNTTGTPSPRERVLNLLGDLITSQDSNLHICVTSGLEQDIRNVLEPLTSTPLAVSLHEENGQKEDITYYVKSLVREDREMGDWKAEQQHLVIKSLLERAGGMFGWVAHQLDTLRRSTPEGILTALDELPAALDEIYARALEKIPDGKRVRARYLFQCLIASVRPLRVEELEDILALKFQVGRAAPPTKGKRRRDSAVSACSSLVAIVEAEDSQIAQLSHFSVKQFLMSSRIEKDASLSGYHISSEPAHTALAHACLTVLLQPQNKLNGQHIGGPPLLFYAAQHWFTHARFGNVAIQPQIQSVMKELFDPDKPHFRGWIRLYDIDLEGEQTPTKHPERVWQLVTPLYYAVLCGLPSLVDDLIVNRPQDINTRGGHHGTALHAALQREDLRVAESLLVHGADVGARDRSNWRPLEKVLDDKHIEALRLLLQRNANVNALDQCEWTPLRRASANGQLKVVRLLLQNGAQVNAADALGWTALHLASFNGHVKVTQLLLENAANVNARTKGDFTPLYVASSRGLIDVVKVLLRYGADVRLEGIGKQSPLRVAFTQEHYQVAKLLAGNSEGW